MEAIRGSPELPPRLYIHSYGGSAAYATSLLKLRGGIGERIYFGFSAAVNLRSPKSKAVIASIPDSRLLLESDLTEAADMQEDCRRMLQVYADVKGWSLQQAAQQTFDNACRFYASHRKEHGS
mmetsp:Transcript_38966/g.110353  ORF Transcript_38966/g.110353 Transcript_38966/m.110353 type:complete len:123 (-) Transcript_38966:428-796(-)